MDLSKHLVIFKPKKQCNEINSSGTVSEEKEIDILQNIVEKAEVFLQQHQKATKNKNS